MFWIHLSNILYYICYRNIIDCHMAFICLNSIEIKIEIAVIRYFQAQIIF